MVTMYMVNYFMIVLDKSPWQIISFVYFQVLDSIHVKKLIYILIG